METSRSLQLKVIQLTNVLITLKQTGWFPGVSKYVLSCKIYEIPEKLKSGKTGWEF